MDENLNQEAPVESSAPSVEDLARDQGWAPKEEFKGEEHKWVDAPEFLRRGELFQKIETQGKANKALQRELSEIREVLAEFKNHHSKVQETAYKKAIDDLKARKEQALEDGDAKALIAVDEQLDEVKEEQRMAKLRSQMKPQRQEPTEEAPQFSEWKSQNTWYEKDDELRDFADTYGLGLANRGKTPDEVLKLVEKKVRETYKHKFENPNRSKPGAVEASARTGTRPGSTYSPTDVERDMAKKFVRSGLFKNEQEYYAELRGNKS